MTITAAANNATLSTVHDIVGTSTPCATACVILASTSQLRNAGSTIDGYVGLAWAEVAKCRGKTMMGLRASNCKRRPNQNESTSAV
eukprot:2085617-Amphidinium_carterae.1